MTDSPNYPQDTTESSHVAVNGRKLARARPNFDAAWTPEEITELRRLAAIIPEIPYSEIARQLGRSKNAVISRCRRSGVPARRAKLSPSTGRPPRIARPIRPKRIAPPRERRAKRPSLWTGYAPPPPREGTVTFAELEKSMCRWQFEHGTYCAAGVAPGFPYCTGHARIVYQRGGR